MKSNEQVEGQLCSDCAKAKGLVPKKEVFGLWIGVCDFCKMKKSVSDALHDWKKEEK